ncbi:MAG: 4-(cytidine 5'-diphospho)-2-C-methyl-D-erythritol kinase [Gaiellaceae bacterium]
MSRLPAAAKINLALAVGGRRPDGLHELVTVMQRVDLCDDVELEAGPGLEVTGFPEDTIVRAALERLADAAGAPPAFRARIRKRIPVAAGLGGGSADAAAALVLANRTLASPLPRERLLAVAASVGADVPFFLEPGPKLAEGAGEQLTPLELPQDYWVLIALPRRAKKGSTEEMYARFDELGGASGFEGRRQALLEGLAAVRRPRDFSAFPANDFSEAAGPVPFVRELRAAGAFRADLSGAGPAVYGLFHRLEQARATAKRFRGEARTWVAAPVW